MSSPKNSCRTLTISKSSPLGSQKVKNGPKIKSKSNVRIERNIENESCSTTLVDLKTVFKHFPNPQKTPIRAYKKNQK